MARSTTDISSNTQATLANVEAQKLNALNREMVDAVLQRSKMELQNQNELLTLQEQALGKTTSQLARAAKEQELLNGFFQAGVPLTSELRARVAELAEAYGQTAERSAGIRLRQDIGFEREQIFRSDGEQAIANRLRGTGIGLDSAEASALRLNEALRQVSASGAGVLSDIGSAAMRGKLGIDTLTNAALRLGDELIKMAANMIIKQFLQLIVGGASGNGTGIMMSGLSGGLGGMGGTCSAD